MEPYRLRPVRQTNGPIPPVRIVYGSRGDSRSFCLFVSRLRLSHTIRILIEIVFELCLSG